MNDVMTLKSEVTPVRMWASLAAAGFVLVSSIIFLLNTRHGIGILPDSVAYMRLGVARHFAPLYTWLLQGVSSFGIDIATAAKWLALAFVGLNTFLVWQLLFASTGSLGHAAVGTGLIVFLPAFVQMHAVAMTEPLLLMLFLCALFLFVQGVDDRRRFWFPLAGIVVGVAMLARFAAAPIMVAFCICRLLYLDRPLGRRLFDCALMGTASVLVFAPWMIASELATGRSTGRAFAFYGNPDAALWWSGLKSLSIMLLPTPVPALVRVAFLIVVVGAVLWTATTYGRRWFRCAGAGALPRWTTVPVVCGLFILSYAGFLILSVYIQASLPLNGRILLPIYVAAVVLTVVIMGRHGLLVAMPTNLRVSLAAVALVVLLAHGARTAASTAEAFANGIGYADRGWASSAVLREVDSLPDAATIYSNAPDVVTFRLRRHAEYVPNRISHLTLREDPDRPFREQMDAMRKGLELKDGYVVFLDRVDWRFYLASEQELVQELSLIKVFKAQDGRIYKRVRTSRGHHGT